MAKNYIQAGKVMPVVAPAGGILSGALVIAVALAGVALTSGAEGEEVTVQLEGVFKLPKVVAEAMPQGTPVYYDKSAKLVTTSKADATADADGETENVLIGHVFTAAAANSAEVDVKLLG